MAEFVDQFSSSWYGGPLLPDELLVIKTGIMDDNMEKAIRETAGRVVPKVQTLSVPTYPAIYVLEGEEWDVCGVLMDACSSIWEYSIRYQPRGRYLIARALRGILYSCKYISLRRRLL